LRTSGSFTSDPSPGPPSQDRPPCGWVPEAPCPPGEARVVPARSRLAHDITNRAARLDLPSDPGRINAPPDWSRAG
jgi:hypothetical protein